VFGTACRARPNGNNYRLTVDSQGVAQIGRVHGGDNARYVVRAHVEDVPLKDGRNSLRAVCIGDDIVRLQLHVNDVLVAEAIEAPPGQRPFQQGAIGMYVEPLDDKPVEAAFDNLVVREPATAR
jgi:hypothetical protein